MEWVTQRARNSSLFMTRVKEKKRKNIFLKQTSTCNPQTFISFTFPFRFVEKYDIDDKSLNPQEKKLLRRSKRRKDINNTMPKSRKTAMIFLVYTLPFLSHSQHQRLWVYHRHSSTKENKATLKSTLDCVWRLRHKSKQRGCLLCVLPHRLAASLSSHVNWETNRSEPNENLILWF